MKNIKRILALLTVVLTLISVAACSKNGETVTTTEPVQTDSPGVTEDVKEPETQEKTTVSVTEPYTEQNTVVPTEQQTTAPALPEESTQAQTKPATTVATTAATTKPVAPTKPVTTTKPVATTAKPVVAPTSKADIVKLYNSAANVASGKKPGYSKTVDTSITNINMGALSKINAVKDVVGDFLGEGKSSSTVSKGSFDGTSLVKSTLKADDVSSAKCTLSSDKKYYIVEITVKNETNPLKKSSALGRFTKDYKDVDEIRAGMNEVGAKVDSITIKTSGVKITAKIAVDTNRFVSVSHSFKMSATLTNVRYTIARVKSATADLSTTVSYSNFKY